MSDDSDVELMTTMDEIERASTIRTPIMSPRHTRDNVMLAVLSEEPSAELN